MNGTRLGTYAEMEKLGWTREGGDRAGQLSLARCVACSAMAGALSSFLASPIFLVKTQLQTSSSANIAVGYQHQHGSVTAAFSNIYKKGGIQGLWQGAVSSIPRISVGSAAQLVTYS